MHECHEGGELFTAANGVEILDGGDEAPVAVAQRVEIPRPVQQVDVGHQRARLGAQDRRAVGEAEVLNDGGGKRLALEMRADGDTGGEEAETGEAEPAAHVVALDPLVLGHRAEHHQPLRAPRRTIGPAEGVDPLRTGDQQFAPDGREVPAHAAPVALARDETVVGEAGDGLAGVLLLDVEQGERLDERGGPRRAALG